MDRRSFVQTGLSALLTYNCSLTRARAGTTLHGCRMAANAGEPLGVMLREYKDKSNLLPVFAAQAELNFRVVPDLGFFDDGEAPNALASPAVLPLSERSFLINRDSYNGTSGTVLMGINLFEKMQKDALFQTPNVSIAKLKTGVSLVSSITSSIVAHEYAHILQYKLGMSPTGPWQMEPHADFLAGWSMGRNQTARNKLVKKEYITLEPRELERSIQAVFERGDYDFNDRRHHGEPEFRAAMLRAGYESHNLDVNQAFEKGKKFAGLN